MIKVNLKPRRQKMTFDNMRVAPILIIGIILIGILAIWLLPLLFIWSLNTLFVLAIPYTLKTWFATLILSAVAIGITK